MTEWLTQHLQTQQHAVLELIRKQHAEILLEWNALQTSVRNQGDVYPRVEENQTTAIGLTTHQPLDDGATDTLSPTPSFCSLIPCEREQVASHSLHLSFFKPAAPAKGQHLKTASQELFQSPINSRENECQMGTTTPALERLVMSTPFELCSALAIMMNTFLTGFELQYRGVVLANKSGFAHPDAHIGKLPQLEAALEAAQVTFSVVFAVEVLLRIGALKKRALWSAWIWFDTFLVCFSTVGNWVSSANVNPSVLRLLRMARVCRIIKMLHVIRVFDSIYILVRSIQASWTSFIWSFLLLLTIQVGTGMLLFQILYSFTSDAEIDFSKREAVFEYFGTLDNTMLTMFEITYGNWIPVCRLLVRDVHQRFDLFFILYRCMFCFAVIRIIAAVFISETSRIVAHDENLARLRKNQDRQFAARKLHKIFLALDESGDGLLSRDEFCGVVEDGSLSEFTAYMGVGKSEIMSLFQTFDSGDGLVSMEEFLDGVAELKSNAKSSEVKCLLALNRKLCSKMDSLLGFFGATDKRLNKFNTL